MAFSVDRLAMDSIFVLEDNQESQELLRAALSTQYSLVFSASLAEARAQVDIQPIALFILDVNLPDGSGFTFLQELRSHIHFRHTPAIILSARGDNIDQITGFKLGADDYITKPFDRGVLLARIEAKLTKSNLGLFQVENLIFDLSRQSLICLENNKETTIGLTAFQFKLASFLAQNIDCIYSRDQLLEHVWQNNLEVNDRTVDVTLSKLRKKIDFTGFTIEAVYGVGYRFVRKKEAA